MADSAVYKKWDIVLTQIGSGTKIVKSPALVVSPEAFNSRHDVVLLFITSDLEREPLFGDYVIDEWQQANLPKPAKVRMQFATVAKKYLSPFSRLSARDIQNFEKVMVNFFNLE